MFLDSLIEYINLSLEFYLVMINAVFNIPRSQFNSEIARLMQYYPDEIVKIKYSWIYTLTLTIILFYSVRKITKYLDKLNHRNLS